MCNITKCCTEVCPEHIKITDNAIIPLKERVVDASYDPVAWLGRKILRRTKRSPSSRAEAPPVPRRARHCRPPVSATDAARGAARRPGRDRFLTAVGRRLQRGRRSPSSRPGPTPAWRSATAVRLGQVVTGGPDGDVAPPAVATAG